MYLDRLWNKDLFRNRHSSTQQHSVNFNSVKFLYRLISILSRFCFLLLNREQLPLTQALTVRRAAQSDSALENALEGANRVHALLVPLVAVVGAPETLVVVLTGASVRRQHETRPAGTGVAACLVVTVVLAFVSAARTLVFICKGI